MAHPLGHDKSRRVQLPVAINCYRTLGIDYLVLQREHQLAGIANLSIENSQYAVYRITE